MKKTNKSLIKQNNLREFLKSQKINRISPEAIDEIENHIQNNLTSLAKKVKELIDIEGKRTAEKKHIKEAIEKESDFEYS